jgi:hypothetical protein
MRIVSGFAHYMIPGSLYGSSKSTTIDCTVQDFSATGDIVLLCGWVKDKKGKSREEVREIAKAKSLYEEFMSEYQGGNI